MMQNYLLLQLLLLVLILASTTKGLPNASFDQSSNAGIPISAIPPSIRSSPSNTRYVLESSNQASDSLASATEERDAGGSTTSVYSVLSPTNTGAATSYSFPISSFSEKSTEVSSKENIGSSDGNEILSSSRQASDTLLVGSQVSFSQSSKDGPSDSAVNGDTLLSPSSNRVAASPEPMTDEAYTFTFSTPTVSRSSTVGEATGASLLSMQGISSSHFDISDVPSSTSPSFTRSPRLADSITSHSSNTPAPIESTVVSPLLSTTDNASTDSSSETTPGSSMSELAHSDNSEYPASSSEYTASSPLEPSTTGSPLRKSEVTTQYSAETSTFSDFKAGSPLEPDTTSSPLQTSEVTTQYPAETSLSSEFTASSPLESSTTSSTLQTSEVTTQYSAETSTSSDFKAGPLDTSTTSSPLQTNEVTTQYFAETSTSSDFKAGSPLEPDTTSSPLQTSEVTTQYSAETSTSSDFKAGSPLEPDTTSSPLQTSEVTTQYSAETSTSSDFKAGPLDTSTTSSPLRKSEVTTQYPTETSSSSEFTASSPLEPDTTSSPLQTSEVTTQYPAETSSFSEFTASSPLESSTTSSTLQTNEVTTQYPAETSLSSEFTASSPLESSTTSSTLQTNEVTTQYPAETSSSSEFTVSSPLESSTASSPLQTSEVTTQYSAETSTSSDFKAGSPLESSRENSQYQSVTETTMASDSQSEVTTFLITTDLTGQSNGPSAYTVSTTSIPSFTSSTSSTEMQVLSSTRLITENDLPSTAWDDTRQSTNALSTYVITTSTSTPSIVPSTTSEFSVNPSPLLSFVESISTSSSPEPTADLTTRFSSPSLEVQSATLWSETRDSELTKEDTRSEQFISTSGTSSSGRGEFSDSSDVSMVISDYRTQPASTYTEAFSQSSSTREVETFTFSSNDRVSLTTAESIITSGSSVSESSMHDDLSDSLEISGQFSTTAGLTPSSVSIIISTAAPEISSFGGSEQTNSRYFSESRSRSAVNSLIQGSETITTTEDWQSAYPTESYLITESEVSATPVSTSSSQSIQSGNRGSALTALNTSLKPSNEGVHSIARSSQGSSDLGVSSTIPTDVAFPTSTRTAWWLPSSIEIQSKTSTASTSFNPSVTAVLPHVIAPQSTVVPAPGSIRITVGFEPELNYEFLVSHPQTTAQIFAFLPSVLVYPFESDQLKMSDGDKSMSAKFVSMFERSGTTTIVPGSHYTGKSHAKYVGASSLIDVGNVQVAQIFPMTLKERDYLISVAVVYFPEHYASDLQSYIVDEESALYQNPNPTFHALARLIDGSIPLTGLIDGSLGSSLPDANEGPHSQSQFDSGSSTTGEKSGSLESTVNSRITVAITRRLLAYLICFVFGVFFWILASLLLYRYIQNRHSKKPDSSTAIEDCEKRGYDSADVTSLRSAASSMPDNTGSVLSRVSQKAASNHCLPEDLVITGENTVYSVSHGLEYYVAEDGSFYYAGALDSTTDGNESTKYTSADMEDIDDFLYSAEHESSSVAMNESSYDIGSLEVDEEGNFVVSDPSEDLEPMALETDNSGTVETYNNRNLYKMMENSNSNEGSKLAYGEAMQPMNTWEINDPFRPYQDAGQSSLSRSAYGFYNSGSGNNFAQYLPGGESIDEYLYYNPIDNDRSTSPLEVQVDDIDDDVVDIHINDLDELDEEMYRRLSKIMELQQNNESRNLHISNVIAAKAQTSSRETRSSQRDDFQPPS